MNEVLNVLCLEDSPQDAEIMRELLIDAGFNLKMDCTAVETEFVSLLRNHKYDLILSDFKLPGFDGFTALRWSVEICPDVPFICISGTVGEETAVELLKKGAVDYILKDRLVRLPSAVQRALEQQSTQIEKRATELLLKENEEKLQSIFSAAPVGIGLVVGRVFIEVNDTFCRMTGYNRSELIGKNAETIYGKDEQNESAGIVIYRYLAENGTGSVETRIKCKDGRILNIFLSSTPLDKDDLTKGVTFIVMDITERKRAEETLLERDRQLSSIYYTIGDILYYLAVEADGRYRFISVNQAFYNVTGLSEEMIVGKFVNEIIPEPSLSIVLGKYRQAIKENSIIRWEEVSDYPTGRLTSDVSIAPVFDDKGNCTHLIGTVHDITKRKLAEETMINERRLLRALIDNLPDMIYVKDIDCRKVIANTADVRNIGFKDESEVLGKTDIELFPDQTGQRVYSDDKMVISSGKAIFEREEDFVDNKGVRRWLLTTKIPLHDKDGEITGLVGIGHDITKRKLAEEELIYAKDKAEEGDRLKTAFLHNISHEIRTPMNAIVGFSALLGEPDLDTQSGKEYIEVIMQSSNHLLAIITDIVDIANIEANLVKIVKNKINVNSTFQLLFNKFIPKANEKKIQLICETGLSDSEALILTDNTKLTQILTNLISNAFKFTDHGYVKIGCVLKEKFLEFSVSDTGIGIPQESHQKIFVRFYQVQDTLSRLYEGTGLGLAIAKSHVELLGGEIWLSSEPGNGSLFFFTIPYEKQVVGTLAVNEIIIPESFVFPLKKTILVAEDIDSNFKLISFFLSGTNSDILRAENGKETVEKFNSNKNIDLILMDIKMPVMDGYTAVKLIRETNTEIPIIAQTAYVEDEEEAIDSGCSGFISKPFDKKHLLKILAEFI